MSLSLSVIMPIYNGAAFLKRALGSVVDQFEDGMEVIAVDDGSCDESAEIAESFRGRMKLEVHRAARSGNWVKATNFGVSRSRGELICFLHQDDYWLPGRVEIIKRLSSRYPTASVLLHPSVFVDPLERRCGVWRCPFGRGERLVSHDEVMRHLVIQNFVSVPAPAVRRTAALAAFPLDESLWFTADWRFWLELPGDWAYEPKPFTAFRLHAGSQTMKDTHDSESFRMQLALAPSGHFAAASEEIKKAANFNRELNVYLAAKYHGGKSSLRRVFRSAAAAGFSGIARALHSSRFLERTSSRLRARLAGWH